MTTAEADTHAPTIPGLWPLHVYVDDDTRRMWHLLGKCGVPKPMIPHVWELLRMGANPDKLIRAIGRMRRGRPKANPKQPRKRGAPVLTQIPMRSLDYMVRVLRQGHAASSDREAIRVFFTVVAEQIEHVSLRSFARKQSTRRAREMSADDFVAAMQQRLSRWRRTQRALQK